MVKTWIMVLMAIQLRKCTDFLEDKKLPFYLKALVCIKCAYILQTLLYFLLKMRGLVFVVLFFLVLFGIYITIAILCSL